MSISQKAPGAAEESPNTPWTLDAVRAAGVDGLAQMLGDVGFILEELAKEPGDLFETRATARSHLAHLLVSEQVIRGAQDALEAHTVVALAEVTRREQAGAARNAAAHEDAAVPSSSVLDKHADGIARRDLSLIARCSPSAAGSSLASARRLVLSMPNMVTALATRKIPAQVAYAVAGATSVRDESQRHEVDEILAQRLPRLDGAGVRQWQAEVATAIMELDPEGAVVRHRRARRRRGVTLTPRENGMANIYAQLPAIDARLLHKRVSLEAERRRAEGADDGHGALMADALVDTVLGREGAMEAVELDLGVIITDRALFRPDSGDAAQIEGYGPVPPEAVRAQLRSATALPKDSEQDPFGADGPATRAVIRRLYTHPTTGELVAVESRGRAFPPAMAKFLTWRDTSCRGPFCNAQTRQHDHIIPFARGGPTSVENGQDACAHCNQKELDTLSVERIDDPGHPGHRVAWTGHAGITRVTGPTPLVRPPRSAAPDTTTTTESAATKAGTPERASPGDAPPGEISPGHAAA
ncbi:HNH endonuclease [Brachybacterium sp. FME24]|uniref:HNH endonuclease n=1 Tax=Brachybacterium sp. FME24 TaxID=2742605 RepID=UPI001867B7BF|nr:HNH endonuclease signature motif containing protein [Brachybacterium sp. FME24]